MNKSDNKASGATVAYVPYKTFKNFILALSESGIPERIDPTVMTGKSGSVKSALKGAMEFLRLIDDEGKPGSGLRALTAAQSKTDWAEALAPIIDTAYASVVDDLSIEKGTAQQLADRFRENANVKGTTLTRAVRFYLNALDDAGIERSAYFKAPPRPRRPSTKKDGEEKDANGNSGGDEVTGGETGGGSRETPKGMVRQSFSVPGRADPVEIVFYDDIKAREWNIVSAYMEGFIELRGGTKE